MEVISLLFNLVVPVHLHKTNGLAQYNNIYTSFLTAKNATVHAILAYVNKRF